MRELFDGNKKHKSLEHIKSVFICLKEQPRNQIIRRKKKSNNKTIRLNVESTDNAKVEADAV